MKYFKKTTQQDRAAIIGFWRMGASVNEIAGVSNKFTTNTVERIIEQYKYRLKILEQNILK